MFALARFANCWLPSYAENRSNLIAIIHVLLFIFNFFKVGNKIKYTIIYRRISLFNAYNGDQCQLPNLQIPKTLPKNDIGKAVSSCSEKSFSL